MPNTGRTQPWQFQRDGKRLSVPVHGNLQLDHAEAMVEAALAGTALLQISSYVTAPEVARRQLQPVLTAYQVVPLFGPCIRKTRVRRLDFVRSSSSL